MNILDTTTEQDWNPITTPDGWIFIASATSEKPGVETEEEVKLTTTTPIVQGKKPLFQITLKHKW